MISVLFYLGFQEIQKIWKVIDACIKSSHLWKDKKFLTLKIICEARLYGDINVANFSNWLLQIGNCTFPIDNDEFIHFPERFCHILNNIDE